MVCQFCRENPATIKIAHVVNEKKIEINLCTGCAERKGIANPMASLPQIFENFIAELVGKEILQRSTHAEGLQCARCGSTWDDFQKTGLFGCDICYQTFEQDLNIVLRRIHGSNQHIGSRPKSQRHKISEAEMRRIKVELQEAIESENFELAAELRDLVRDAQRELDTENDGIIR
ncbi:MAG: UvrB/UvrC motif-containing protein [bacterium]